MMAQATEFERPRELPVDDAESALRATPLFKELPAEELLYLLPHTQKIEFQAEQILAEEGRPWDRLLVIQRGHCEVFKSRGGLWKQVLSKAGPGSPLMLIPVLDQRPAPATIRALDEGTALSIDAAAVRRLLASSPGFAFHVLLRVSGRIRGLANLAGELSLLTLEERLVRFLLRNAPLVDDPDGDEGSWHYTHEEVANLLGGCREEITRLLSKLKKKGLIATGRRRVQIVDYEGLRRLAPRLPGSEV